MEHECMGPKLTHAEGFILGVGAKKFTIAGPVIVYGVAESAVYGLIYWITTLVYRKPQSGLDALRSLFVCIKNQERVYWWRKQVWIWKQNRFSR